MQSDVREISGAKVQPFFDDYEMHEVRRFTGCFENVWMMCRLSAVVRILSSDAASIARREKSAQSR